MCVARERERERGKREKEREREGGRERNRGKERERNICNYIKTEKSVKPEVRHSSCRKLKKDFEQFGLNR